MWRIFGFILFSVICVGLLFFASSHLTGTLNLQFANRDISMPYSVAAIAIIVLIGFFIFLDRLVRWFFNLPFISPLKRNIRRQAKGFQAINKGLVAIAAGNSKEALKQAQKAENLNGRNSITHLLTAQAALSANDEDEAVKRYTELLKDSETRLMGYRGLFSLAIKHEKHSEALAIAKRAYQLHPDSQWAFSSLFDLHIRTGNFDDALLLIPKAIKKQHLSALEGRHFKAVLITEVARIKELSGNSDIKGIFGLLKNAHKEEPTFIPTVLGLVRSYLSQGQKHKALHLIEKSWEQIPRHDLASLWLQTQDQTAPEDLYKAAKNLASLNSQHEESRLLVAEYALKAEEWDDAENVLLTLLSEHDIPQQRTLRLLAKLEEKDPQKGDTNKIRHYILQMETARLAPFWVCDISGIPAKDWRAISPAGKFDGLRWSKAGEVINNNALLLQDSQELTPSLLLQADATKLPVAKEKKEPEIIIETKNDNPNNQT